MVDRSISGAIGASGGSAVALVGTFLPWLRSGTRNRSSYTIFDLVERLGFAPDGVVAWSLRLWPLVPLLLVAVTVTAWAVVARHLRWEVTMGVAVVALLWVGGTALALVLAPDASLFRIGIGPAVTLVGVLVAVVGVTALRRRESGVEAVS